VQEGRLTGLVQPLDTGSCQTLDSVNGSEEKAVSLSSDNRTQEAAGEHTLQLEDFKMVPGDLVSYYGVAKDGTGVTAQTEMYFLQVRPFERNYTQGQGGGGGMGGGGGQDTFLSEKQKEIIAATWNVVRNSGRQSPEQLKDAGEVLSEVQRGLREQAETLAARVSRRETVASTSAPRAPMEAASVGAAMPPIMDPSTAKMSMNGGITTLQMRRNSWPPEISARSAAGMAGAI